MHRGSICAVIARAGRSAGVADQPARAVNNMSSYGLHMVCVLQEPPELVALGQLCQAARAGDDMSTCCVT